MTAMSAQPIAGLPPSSPRFFRSFVNICRRSRHCRRTSFMNLRTVASLFLMAAVVSACSTNPDVAKKKHFDKAKAYVAQKKYKEAIVEYRSAIQVDAKYGEARLRLADVYLEVGDQANAYKEAIRAADLLPDNADAQVKAGNLLLVNQHFDDAKTRALAVLKKNPRSVDAQILLGNTLAGLKDLDAAVKQIQEALTLDPEESRIYENLGVLEWARGNKKDAEAAFTHAVDSDPKSVTARLALANYYWSGGRMADAELWLKRAIALDPRHVDANRALGVFYLATNQ